MAVYKKLLILSISLVLAACASKTNNYYSLLTLADNAVASASPVLASAQAAGLVLQVTTIPAQADRLQIVVQNPTAHSSAAVDVLNQSLWSASLQQQIEDLLSADVSAYLGLVNTQGLPADKYTVSRNISVAIARFDMLWGKAAVLHAVWSDAAADKPAQGRLCQAELRAPAQASVASLVQAQTFLLKNLAYIIANTESGSTPSLQSGVEVSKLSCT